MPSRSVLGTWKKQWETLCSDGDVAIPAVMNELVFSSDICVE